MPLRVDVALPTGGPAEHIRTHVGSLWRYDAMLPVDGGAAVTLGEGWTPVLAVGDGVWVKDESRNPTGSFKARGMSLAVSAAVARGAQRLVAPSAGNAAGALAAYGARAGVAVAVAMPADTPRPFVDECRHYGAQVDLVDGTIADAGRFLAERRTPDDVDVSTMREPYRVEGKKTMG
jgi:threonine synthase